MEVQAQEHGKQNSAMAQPQQMLQQQVQPLANLLSELCALYEELYTTLKLEKKYLIGADIPGLKENNKLKEALLYKIRALDRHREKLANELALKLGLTLEDARLLKLASKLLGEDAACMKAFHKKLSQIIRQVTEYNSENSQYAESALKIFDGAISEIKQTVTTKSTYGKQGKMAGSSETNSGNFVSKEA